MIHIIYGDESYKINAKIREIVDQREVVKYDIIKSDIIDIYKDIATIDLFSEEKVYIFENLDIFEIKKSKLNKNQLLNMSRIIDLNNEVIIIANRKLNEKTAYYENYFSKIKYYEYISENIDLQAELNKYVKENEIVIDSEAKQLLLTYHQEIYGLVNDVDKMWQYANMTEINEKIVKAVGINYVTYKVFALYEDILRKNKEKAKEYYLILKEQGIDDVQMLLIFLTQIRKYFEIKVAMGVLNNNIDAVAKHLKMNSYQVRMLNKVIVYIDRKVIFDLMNLASEVDYLYKSGQVSATNAMEMMMI